MRVPQNHGSAGAGDAFTEIMGRKHVLTSARATAPYPTRDRSCQRACAPRGR